MKWDQTHSWKAPIHFSTEVIQISKNAFQQETPKNMSSIMGLLQTDDIIKKN